MPIVHLGPTEFSLGNVRVVCHSIRADRCTSVSEQILEPKTTNNIPWTIFNPKKMQTCRTDPETYSQKMWGTIKPFRIIQGLWRYMIYIYLKMCAENPCQFSSPVNIKWILLPWPRFRSTGGLLRHHPRSTHARAAEVRRRCCTAAQPIWKIRATCGEATPTTGLRGEDESK